MLLCPEDQSQMAVGKEMLFDKLPDDVKAKVVWREQYWLTDEAVSTYVRSRRAVRQRDALARSCALATAFPPSSAASPEQTSKGFMWRDIGLGDWLFDLDEEADVRRVAPAVLALAQNPAAAKDKAVRARDFVRQRQRETMAIVQRELPYGRDAARA